MGSDGISAKLEAARRCIVSVHGDASILDAAIEAGRLYADVLRDTGATPSDLAAAMSGLADMQSIADVPDLPPAWTLYATAAVLDPGNSYNVVGMAGDGYLPLSKTETGKAILGALIRHIHASYTLNDNEQRTIDQLREALARGAS